VKLPCGGAGGILYSKARSARVVLTMREETELQYEEDVQQRQQSHYGRFVTVFLVLVIVAGAYFLYSTWRMVHDEAAKTNAVDALRLQSEAEYARAMADTYGGKTPQETLQLYIAAVEKGNYELASKYFIGDYREKELNSLRNSKKENIDNVVQLLKITVKSDGSYSAEKNRYVISEPLLVDFKLYPNGVWKIIEI
jgi:hypothetical protein